MEEDYNRAKTELLNTALLDCVHGVVVYDKAWNVQFANRVFAQAHGYSIKSILQLSRTDIVAPDSHRSFSEFVRDLAVSEHCLREVNHCRIDGSIIRLYESNSVFYENENNPGGILCITCEEVTEKDKITDLMRSEERYRTLIENATIGFYRTSVEGKILFANPSLVEMLGYSSLEELSGRNLEQNGFEPGYPREKFKQLIGNRGEIRGLEFAWKRKDGETLYIRESAVEVKDEEGNTLYYDGTVEDISIRKQAEAKLGESEQKYRLLADNSTDLIFSIGLDTTLRYVSPAVKSLFGYTLEELTAIDYADLMAPDSLKKMYEIHAKWPEIQENHPGERFIQSMELEIIRKDGEHIWIEALVNPVWTDNDEIESLTGTARDITSRKIAEQARQRSEEILNAVSYAAERFLAKEYHDSDFVEALQFLGEATRVCRAYIFREYPGNSSESILRLEYSWVSSALPPGKKGFSLAGSSFEEAGIEKWREQLIAGKSMHGVISDFPESETIAFRKDQIKSLIVVPVSTGEKLWGFMGFDDCQTARQWSDPEIDALKTAANTFGAAIYRRQYEEEKRLLRERMHSSQKLESLGILAGGIAHDFNNLLQTIIGNANLIMDDAAGHPAVMEGIEHINTAVRQAAKLTQQMLAYSGRLNYDIEKANLNRQIINLKPLIKGIVTDDVVVDYCLKEDIPSIKADIAQLRQMILNLVMNSTEAIKGKGSVTIASGEQDLIQKKLNLYLASDHVREGRFVFLEISDDGEGMSQEVKNRIFDPFFTTKFTGRGLGMASVLGIVRAMGGAIQIASTVDEGTMVRIYFPAQVYAQDTDKKPEHDSLEMIGRGSILLLSSSIEGSNVCKRMLEKLGYNVFQIDSLRKSTSVLARKGNNTSTVLIDSIPNETDLDGTISYLNRLKPGLRICISEELKKTNSEAPDYDEFNFIAKPYRFSDFKVLF